MRLIYVGSITVLFLIIRIIEVIFSLYLVFYIHDIILYVLVSSILIYGLIYRKHYLKELFHRIDRLSVKIVNLSLLVILWLLILIFSIYAIIMISDYLLTLEMNQLGWALRDMLYGKHVGVMQYLIQLMPLLTYAMFFDLKRKNKHLT